LTLACTTSNTYQALNAAISKPALLLTALSRQATRSAMTDLLARLDMPSREDVLALSQRLTRIELVLDDVAAGMDELRRRPRPQERPAAGKRGPNADGAAAPIIKKVG
jgi:hypothetical protein